MTTFLIEAIVLCVLFHLGVLLQVRKEPAERVYGYPSAIVERYIQLGKIPDKKESEHPGKGEEEVARSDRTGNDPRRRCVFCERFAFLPERLSHKLRTVVDRGLV